MSKEFTKGLIDSVESTNQAESKLKITIRNLKEEINRLNFTIGEQRSIIQNQKSIPFQVILKFSYLQFL